ncbi:GTP-binding protein [Fusarium acuminatum]|uniref:GTP-binding protein n=1 Tax=Fusarium acuminatum TaxID=5515 RepID=A0ABZ2WFX5_9HYPO
MASVFTYDPDPPRVHSPWKKLRESSKDENGHGAGSEASTSALQLQSGLLSEYGLTKLEAEPQEGPIEYKLHLLLRPRRLFKSMSTAGKSRHARLAKPSTPSPAASSQPRQQRLQHLTTQLLWRLQQSSPYHASSSKELALPRLPDDNVDLTAPVKLNKLVPGLEESRGAIYEIGVADDGNLVGLTNDEMEESLATLRVMAASLGCTVDVRVRVVVGDCEWTESTEIIDGFITSPNEVIRSGKLWVAEAEVKPNLGFTETADGGDSSYRDELSTTESMDVPSRGSSMTPQLRVTFTGPTTSGKSSLLGTLSSGALDNGRGNSRLSLLKHRHEMVTGVTSSIAQELIGYKDGSILNYSHGNIESWVDIHDRSEGGRLVFVSDSAGHPRYRRTVLRGLMNWAPHWIILCLAADDTEVALKSYGTMPSTQDVLGVVTGGVDLVKAHLTLSLKLGIPLAVVITKLDLASKKSLSRTTNKILSAIKDAGRKPKILRPDQKDAVKGNGIGLLHALLENLPLPPPPTARDYVGMALNPEQPKCLFHIDHTLSLSESYSSLACNPGEQAKPGIVVLGHLRFGRLSIGDKIVIGPFPSDDDEALRELTLEDRQSPGSYGLSASHPSSAEIARIAMKNAVSASTITGEWHDAQISSIHNLRLPVLTLEAGQAGSIGLRFQPRPSRSRNDSSNSNIAIEIPRIRRGMILAIPSKHMADTGLKLQAASGFTAIFDDLDAQTLPVGSFVNIYIASIRTVARVHRISRQNTGWGTSMQEADEMEEIFNLNDDLELNSEKEPDQTKDGVEMGLELLHHREWIEMGSRVVLLEGGSQDRSGLEGFVGKVVEIVD